MATTMGFNSSELYTLVSFKTNMLATKRSSGVDETVLIQNSPIRCFTFAAPNATYRVDDIHQTVAAKRTA